MEFTNLLFLMLLYERDTGGTKHNKLFQFLQQSPLNCSRSMKWKTSESDFAGNYNALTWRKRDSEHPLQSVQSNDPHPVEGPVQCIQTAHFGIVADISISNRQLQKRISQNPQSSTKKVSPFVRKCIVQFPAWMNNFASLIANQSLHTATDAYRIF